MFSSLRGGGKIDLSGIVNRLKGVDIGDVGGKDDNDNVLLMNGIQLYRFENSEYIPYTVHYIGFNSGTNDTIFFKDKPKLGLYYPIGYSNYKFNIRLFNNETKLNLNSKGYYWIKK